GIGEPGRPVREGIAALDTVILGLVHLVMRVAPVGVGALVAGRLGLAGGYAGFLPELERVGAYSLVVLTGLAIHGIILLPLALWCIGKRNPLSYARGVAPALLTAISTSS